MWNKSCMRFSKQTGRGSVLSFIQIDWDIYEKMRTERLHSHTTMTLNDGQEIQAGVKLEGSDAYHQNKFE